MTATSRNFLQWSEPEFLEYTGAPREHLYTNAIQLYPRAPHMLIGFPTRYLPKEGERVEPTFMSSRDGRTFHRWQQAVIPETASEDRSGNRSNYMTWGLVQLPGRDKEFSVYATESYYSGPDSRLRRFTYRVDGFVSLQAGADGGQLLTKPLVFAGQRLTINFVTSDSGNVRVELQDTDGNPLEDFGLTACSELHGDAIAHVVRWKDGPDVSSLAGKPIRLRFELKHANLFAFQFCESASVLPGKGREP